MYTTVLDMMATLIHSAVVGDSQAEKPEENKRHYQTLAKKLRKVPVTDLWLEIRVCIRPFDLVMTND